MIFLIVFIVAWLRVHLSQPQNLCLEPRRERGLNIRLPVNFSLADLVQHNLIVTEQLTGCSVTDFPCSLALEQCCKEFLAEKWRNCKYADGAVNCQASSSLEGERRGVREMAVGLRASQKSLLVCSASCCDQKGEVTTMVLFCVWYLTVTLVMPIDVLD